VTSQLHPAALISTAEGKTITSTYLAKRVEMLEIGETITLDIDSEMHVNLYFSSQMAIFLRRGS
jgi:hypothetical protein